MIAYAVARQPGNGLVEHVHLQGEPLAVVGKTRRRHHAIEADRGALIVELQHKTGLDDMLYLVRIADPIARINSFPCVILVLAVRDDAHRRGNQKKCFRDISAALKLAMSRLSSACPL